jgi:hypothetical protein
MHRKTRFKHGIKRCVVASGLIAGGESAHADFLADSKVNLEARNLYFSRDFRQDGGSLASGQSKAQEWGQGFMLRADSGYTDGLVGMGVDAIGMLGLKLDSSNAVAGTGLFPTGGDGKSEDEYSKLGLTAKAKVSKSTIKFGSLIFRNQLLLSPDGRLLPQMFKGGMAEFNEISNLSIQAARISSSMSSQSGHWQKLVANRFGGEGDNYSFYGADYKFQPASTIGLHYGVLDNVFKQYVANASHVIKLNESQTLKLDARFSKSSEDGNYRPIDNKATGLMATYRINAHSVGFGYQKMIGDDPFPYVANTDPYLTNFIQINDFGNINEKSWQARYDLDFAAYGIPGLGLMARYAKGDDVKLSGGGTGREWERDTDVFYAFQGNLKNLSVRVRNATVRSTFGNDLNEYRIIVQYMLPIL